MDIEKELSRAYDQLQHLQITASQKNMEILMYTLSVLKRTYDKLSKERVSSENGNDGKLV